MALAFTNLSWWLPSGKHKEPRISNGSPVNSVSDAGMESDNLKFPLAKSRAVSSSRNVKRKWRSREERKIDREYDIVLVPPDGGCISGSESDDREWSIGWLEPHGPGFQSDDDSDDSFAVLVPCYGKVHDYLIEDSDSKIVGAVAHIAEIYSAEREIYGTVAVYPPKQLICNENFQVTTISMCCGYKSGEPHFIGLQ